MSNLKYNLVVFIIFIYLFSFIPEKISQMCNTYEIQINVKNWVLSWAKHKEIYPIFIIKKYTRDYL